MIDLIAFAEGFFLFNLGWLTSLTAGCSSSSISAYGWCIEQTLLEGIRIFPCFLATRCLVLASILIHLVSISRKIIESDHNVFCVVHSLGCVNYSHMHSSSFVTNVRRSYSCHCIGKSSPATPLHCTHVELGSGSSCAPAASCKTQEQVLFPSQIRAL